MRIIRRLCWALLGIFIIMNAVAFVHAYKFTHFSGVALERTKDPKALSTSAKVKTLFTGIDNPRPKLKTYPSQPYQVVKIKSTALLECWSVNIPHAKGTVILFHGYSGEKSSLILRSDEFIKLGYNTFMVDFIGSGGSEGDVTTIGFKEAEQVKDCFDHIQRSGEQKIYLFGTSMGAAAILKAMDDYPLEPSAILLECPFGSLYKTVCARFDLMGVPSFPMAGLLSFWGGVQNGYWAFGHNPAYYARSVSCPALILFGEEDNRVSRKETDLIYANLKGYKVLKTYPDAGHDVFPKGNRRRWTADVSSFLQEASKNQP